MSAMCPHCGYSLQKDVPLEIGPWRLSINQARFNGVELGLTRAEAGVLYTLARSRGEWVSSDVILNRVSDSDNPNVIAVFVSRIRRKLADKMPIQSRKGGGQGGGYRWIYVA